MKNKSIIALVATVIVVVLVSLLALNGLTIGNFALSPVGGAISLGLDLRGGVYAVYVATDTEQENFDTLLQGTITALRDRLTAQGFTEATVAQQGGNRIRVEIPDVSNPDQILDIIGTPAHLEFIDPAGNVVIEGADIKKAQAVYLDGTTTPVVSFELNDSGREAFATATRENVGRIISIELDGRTISTPRVETAITNGAGYIDGMADAQEAINLAMLIMSGALPLDIEQDEVSAVSATLGVEALNTSIIAGVIGLILVMLFMLAIYRMPGLMADLALCIYVLIVLYALAIARVQLTLPGIAGILLGIGMAVDANVIIFERFREELKAGSRLELAVKRGFKNAISAVVDSNVTTIIAALVLMYFGTGTIKGFAITLLIGVIVSLFTAVFVTRWLLRCAVNLSDGNNLKLYTRPFRESKDSGRRYTGHTRLFAGVSIGLLVVAIVMSLVGVGMNMGIDFTGGSLLRYEVGQAYNVADVESALRDMGVSEFQIAKAGTGDDPTELQIRLKLQDDSDELRAQLQSKLTEKYSALTFLEIDHVGAVAGQDLIANAVKSMLIAFACMLVYIAIRFDFYSGLAALIALVHDALIMCAFMVFFRGVFQVNSSFIAALLTIVGYSINNTIVIFDRIRETAKHADFLNRPRAEVVEASVSRTISRTLNTTITTLITLVVLFIMGVGSIKEFAFPLLVGMLAGTYSSVLLSGQIWAVWQDHNTFGKIKALFGKKARA